MAKGNWASVSAKYRDEEQCRNLFVKYMWPNGVECTKCGHLNSTDQLVEMSGRKMNTTFKCENCQKNFIVKTNCILTGSRLSFRSWLEAIYRIAIKAKSTPSLGLPEEINVIQDSAWKMFLRISQLAKQDVILENQIEMDEWYEGPKPQYQHKYAQGSNEKRGIIGETLPVFGMVERAITKHNKVIKPAKVVLQLLNAKGKRSVAAVNIKPIIDKFVSKSPNVVFFTDAAKIYQTSGLFDKRTHLIVPHNVNSEQKKKTKKQKEKERKEKVKLRKKGIVKSDEKYVLYKNGFCVHTNNIEGVFSQLSKYIRGTHNKVTRNYMQKYLDLFCFRWNNQHLSTEEQIYKLLSNLDKVPHKNITWLKTDEPLSRKSKQERIFITLHKTMMDYLNQIPYKQIMYRNMFLWTYQCMLEESLSEDHKSEVSEYPYEYTEYLKEYLKKLNQKIKNCKKADKWAKYMKSEYTEESKVEDIYERIENLKMRVKIGIDIEEEREEISKIRAERQRACSRRYYEKQKQKKLQQKS